MLPKKPKTVLLVEDDTDLNEHTTSLLEEAGFQVISVDTLKDARFKVSNQKFDVLLFDFRVGAGTTEELVKSIRASKFDPNYVTPILMISANLDMAVLQRIREKINGAIIKPFTSEALVARLNQICGAATSNPADQQSA